MRFFLLAVLCSLSYTVSAQELFVFTEPASNMAAKSIGVRLNNSFMESRIGHNTAYGLQPEVMFGFSRKLMLHISGYFSNTNGPFVADGGTVYAKYRFYNRDDVHSHFRMAAFGRYGLNKGPVADLAIEPGSRNSSYEGGMVATSLKHKWALSATISMVHALDNEHYIFPYASAARNALNYSFSTGRLLLPKVYTNFEQVNMNGLLEFPGQVNLYKGTAYLDMAPVVQFIFRSRMILSAGYRFPLVTSIYRTLPQGALVRFEYNFFNAFK